MINIKVTDIKFLESIHINKQKWDESISESPINNVFMYSWYLDAVADNWSGIVSGDYATVLPITSTRKIGIKQFNQVVFTREFEVVGNDFTFQDCIPLIKAKFKNSQFRTSSQLDVNHTERVHQYLTLNDSFDNEYSTNAKRLIKKSNKHYTYKTVACIDELIDLVKENIAHKIKEFTPNNIAKLKQLMGNASSHSKGETIAVFEDDKIVAAGFFLKDKSTVTYLKGASTDGAKKNGAMFGLMNYAFSNYCKAYSKFDFGGSDINSVATFYKKFGAVDKKYYEYTINNLPLWFRLLKKLKI